MVVGVLDTSVALHRRDRHLVEKWMRSYQPIYNIYVALAVLRYRAILGWGGSAGASFLLTRSRQACLLASSCALLVGWASDCDTWYMHETPLLSHVAVVER